MDSFLLKKGNATPKEYIRVFPTHNIGVAKHTAKSLSVYDIGDRGVTPSQYLNSQEKILYESRPKLMSVIGLKLLVWLVIASIIFLPIAAIVSGGAGAVVLLIWFVVAIVPVLVGVLRWRAIFYTLTDQRILTGRGIGGKDINSVTIQRTTGLLDVHTARVTGVIMDLPLAGRMFGYGNLVFQTTVSPVKWLGVKHPTDVRRYVEETLNRSQEIAGQDLIARDEVARTVAGITAQQKMGFLPQQAPYQVAGATTPPTTVLGQQTTGVSLPTGQQPVAYCAKCGAPYQVGTKYCPNCGTPLATAKALEAEA
ncbi:MAG: hypothetical protein AUI33_06405 [Ignavibacteria bacterium 13_1_40CM_2_61_4]|nr:MAG: hypothetical protein AUI33_06405 [Ignavibacteria bacterium 13_1_40CM_2_61_4]